MLTCCHLLLLINRFFANGERVVSDYASVATQVTWDNPDTKTVTTPFNPGRGSTTHPMTRLNATWSIGYHFLPGQHAQFSVDSSMYPSASDGMTLMAWVNCPFTTATPAIIQPIIMFTDYDAPNDFRSGLALVGEYLVHVDDYLDESEFAQRYLVGADGGAPCTGKWYYHQLIPFPIGLDGLLVDCTGLMLLLHVV